MVRWFAVFLLAGLAGCASKAPVPVADSQSPTRIEAAKVPQALAPTGKLHLVKKGDTLFSIAREHGLNPRDLAAWNNLDNSNRISVGQQLRLTPPAAPTAQPAATIAPDGTEVRPIAASGTVVARPLDGAPAAAPAPTSAAGAVPPAPTLLPGNTDTFKRGPKGGKLPYSEENLARLKGQEPAPAPEKTAAPPAPAASPASAAPPAPTVATGIDWGWPANGKLLANFSDGNAGAQGLNRGIDIAGSIGDPVLAAAPGKVIFVGVYPKHGNLVVLLHAEGYSTVYAHNHRVLVKEGQVVKRGQRIADLGNSDADEPKLHFELRQQGKPLDPLKYLPAR
ncbi:MAG: peptidoglycan DD-metalloendopeptidase family protein [Pseudomonadota bacterium]